MSGSEHGGGARRFLLVLCHGHGADSAQMAGLSSALLAHAPQALPFLPDAPHRCRSGLLPAPGRRWFPLGASPPRQRRVCARSARWLNRRIDEQLARNGIEPADLVLGGFSQGAMVTLLAGLARPVAPRGIIALAGALMLAPGPVPAAGHPPVLLIHGDADPVVPFARSVDAEARLREAGRPVRLVTLPGADHMITESAAPYAAAFLAEIAA